MTNESVLVGLELDVAVAKLEGHTVVQDPMKFNDGSWWIWNMIPSNQGGTDIHKSTMMQIGNQYSPSTNWLHGGEIIERERIELQPLDDNGWAAMCNGVIKAGGTALTAAMRAYVASKTDSMQLYIVKLIEFYDGKWLDQVNFECLATDIENAEYQALEAYPCSNVFSVALKD